ncbi:glycosyltransferase family 2 protein [Prevotella sp. 10(H)]|uniref:glycosyltransferase family 2 protein n=1 Tax=Prevotella sp. 10(H) TaxID=1158294 RepID=UPI0004A749E9|nr:glycosyltransferase family 2 protein [Prevotella sp. 10(H)]
MASSKKVSIVICCYNEESNIPTVVNAIHTYMDTTGYQYEIIAVNDGSNDSSQALLEKMSSEDPQLFYIEFSRNFGHQNALKAGLDNATGDCIISMDADMQHPPRILPDFIKKWEEGYDIVYTRREDDPSLSKKKRTTSGLFYKLLNFVSDIHLEQGVADFRLMDRRAANVLINIEGSDLFIRGIVHWIGFKQYAMDYMPDKRLSGQTKYTFKKMRHLAVQGILSFSTKPLNMALYLGFGIALLSLLLVPYAIISLWTGHVMAGWVSLICTVGFLGGLQLFILGIIGLYIGRIFAKTKGFPPYIIRSSNIDKE